MGICFQSCSSSNQKVTVDILISVIIFLQKIRDYDASKVLSLLLNKHCLRDNYKDSDNVCDVLCLRQYI